jgi:leucyl-tRNA synthetase
VPVGPGGVVDLRPLSRAIDAVGRDVERLKFNTAISHLMQLVRWAEENADRMSEVEWSRAARTTVLLLAPFAPHLSEELWSRLGGTYSVHQQDWPEVDEASLRDEVVTLVVQVNGKVRDRIEMAAGTTEHDAVKVALTSDRVRRHLDGRTPRTGAFVPDRLLNLTT